MAYNPILCGRHHAPCRVHSARCPGHGHAMLACAEGHAFCETCGFDILINPPLREVQEEELYLTGTVARC